MRRVLVQFLSRNLIADMMEPAHWSALVPSTIAGYLFELDERVLYVGFYNDGALKGFVIDPANPLGIYWLATGYSAAYWDPLLRELFVLDGSTLKQWDAGAALMTATFKSKVYRQIEQSEPEWLEVMASGNVGVKIYTEAPNSTDDNTALVLRMDATLTRGERNMPDTVVGRDFQVEVTTSREVQGVVGS
jgi:hypothetical protein